ncbi:MAG: hypothetical protein BHW36_09635 [Firmicutes bacterium CAG:24053_14]|nr:MAG: hypothetical protein BHW36_09635 [Firmicutes bacterium CAG:24053_14]
MLFLITVWQLFKAFGGPISESEHPLQLIARSSIFALLIGYAKPIFEIVLDQVFEDRDGHQWFAIHGESVVERKPVYDNGKPVYDERGVVSKNVESVRYRSTPSRFGDPKQRDDTQTKPPRRKS